MDSRQPFLHVGAGFGNAYKNETHFQVEDRSGAGDARRGGGCGGAKVIALSTDSYLSYRKKAVDAITAARVEDQVDLDKKYMVEVNARLVKLVGAVKAKGLSGKVGTTVQSLVVDNGMTPRADGVFLKSNDGTVSLVVTTVPLLKAWVGDVGIKYTDDVAVIFESETFYTDLFGDDEAVFPFPCRNECNLFWLPQRLPYALNRH